jgi:hypothetical protein
VNCDSIEGGIDADANGTLQLAVALKHAETIAVQHDPPALAVFVISGAWRFAVMR